MRRTFAAVLVVLALVLSVVSLAGGPATASDESRPAVVPGATALTERAAVATLERAEGVLSGADVRLSPTLALRDLFHVLPSLAGEDRTKAEGLLGRPTNPDDPNGDAYTVASKKTCSAKICVHWVPSTADAPPSRSWVRTTMEVMRKTWSREIGQLGYRRPVTDGGRGGNEKFDVYLKDVGSEGYYGYCAPERRKPGHKWLASGYCVLDNDFARAQFGAKPKASLRVTAAHEFFHAIQFAYDYGEDRWLMEATATWMEERVADDVNDNRQYLRHGQVAEPGDPLDLFDPSAFDQYGNWAFFEYLSTRFGTGVVRKVWSLAGAYKGAPDLYSTQAVRSALPRKRSWTGVFRAYAAGNTIPGRTYPEGRNWPSASMAASRRLSPADPGARGTLEVDHLAARNVVVRPDDTLNGRSWMLRVTVDGPRREVRPAAYVLVHKRSGKIARKAVPLDRDGDGRITFRFNAGSVSQATVTLANASARFNCWEQETTYSCQGRPKDDDKRFGYALKVLQR